MVCIYPTVSWTPIWFPNFLFLVNLSSPCLCYPSDYKSLPLRRPTAGPGYNIHLSDINNKLPVAFLPCFAQNCWSTQERGEISNKQVRCYWGQMDIGTDLWDGQPLRSCGGNKWWLCQLLAKWNLCSFWTVALEGSFFVSMPYLMNFYRFNSAVGVKNAGRS